MREHGTRADDRQPRRRGTTTGTARRPRTAERRTERTRTRPADTADDELPDTDDEEFDDEEPDTDTAPGRARPRRLSAVEAAAAGVRGLAELVHREAQGVTEVRRADDGWQISVEVLEDRRIPSSTDVLAVYQVELDEAGELVSYRRVARYPRGHGDGGRS